MNTYSKEVLMMKMLNEKQWKPEIIGELFNVSGSVTTKPEDIIPNGNTPRVRVHPRIMVLMIVIKIQQQKKVVF